jgi:hypothetical protein
MTTVTQQPTFTQAEMRAATEEAIQTSYAAGFADARHYPHRPAPTITVTWDNTTAIPEIHWKDQGITT